MQLSFRAYWFCFFSRKGSYNFFKKSVLWSNHNKQSPLNAFIECVYSQKNLENFPHETKAQCPVILHYGVCEN